MARLAATGGRVMGAITLGGILRAEHDLIAEAIITCADRAECIRDNYNYVFGVNDLAEKLINQLGCGDGGNGDN